MYYSALIGKTTRHSVSHILFEELTKILGVKNYQHLRIDLDSYEIENALASFKTLKFVGINVTMPYKTEIIRYLDGVDENVSKIGAVNTIKFDYETVGYNTDWLGIYRPVILVNNKPSINNVTVFGDGGASRAAIYASQKLGAKAIYVCSKSDVNKDRLSILKNDFGNIINLRQYNVIEDLVNDSQLIINATSTGMAGNDPSPFELSNLDKLNLESKLFFDVVFNPTNTPLLEYFKKAGAQTIDGLWMMIYQAIEALSIWLSESIEIDHSKLSKIHRQLERAINDV